MTETFCPQYCPSCSKLNQSRNCPIRMKEWMKGINTILLKKRPKGEGSKMGDEFINFMAYEFMTK